VTIAVAETAGAKCSDAFNPLQSMLRTARKQGVILLDRTQSYIDSFIPTVEQNTTDNVRAYFVNRTDSPFLFDPLLSLPPPGTCQVHQTSGNVFRGAPLRGTPGAASALDAGAIKISTPQGDSDLVKVTAPQTGLAGVVGSARVTDGVGPTKLDFANVTNITVNGPLGTVTVQPNAANLFPWTTKTGLDRLRRDITNRISFTANDFTSNYLFSLTSYSAVFNASVSIVCVNPPGRDTFLLTPDLLNVLPPSYGKADGSFSMMGIGAVPLNRAVPLKLPGLDAGYVLFGQWQTRSVYLQ
jgi:hypothetical protein